MSTPSRYALLASLLLTAGVHTTSQAAEDASAPTPAAAAKETAAELIAKAKAALEAERFADALAAANQAVLADATDYKARYYQSFAYLTLGQFNDADTSAAKALALAPEEAKPKVQKLIATIKDRRASAGGIEAADAALASGLAGKAARLYAQAWAADKSKPEIAVKAAELYAGKLGQPVEAGRLLREVIRADAGERLKAEAALKKIGPELRKMAKAKVKEAQTHADNPAKILTALQQAEEADPSYGTIYNTRAHVVAQTGSAADLVKALEGLAQHDLVGVEDLASLPGMEKWMKDPAIIECLADLVGAVKLGEIKGMIGKYSRAIVAGRIDFPGESLKDARQEAEQGDAEAQYQLASRVWGAEKRKWLHLAADQDHAGAQYKLGVCYADGWAGFTENHIEAVKWYRKAAEQGHAEAQYDLGNCYSRGELDIARDEKEAQVWYRKAVEGFRKLAEQGDAKAQYHLGFAYYCGNGVPEDKEEAVKWYRKAAEQGDVSAKDALKELGK